MNVDDIFFDGPEFLNFRVSLFEAIQVAVEMTSPEPEKHHIEIIPAPDEKNSKKKNRNTVKVLIPKIWQSNLIV